MRGGSLTRYRPDDYQGGKGFLRDLASSSLRSGWQGLKKGGVAGLPINVKGAIRGIKSGGKRAVKRKAQEVVKRAVKRKLDDIFGK